MFLQSNKNTGTFCLHIAYYYLDEHIYNVGLVLKQSNFHNNPLFLDNKKQGEYYLFETHWKKIKNEVYHGEEISSLLSIIIFSILKSCYFVNLKYMRRSCHD